MPKFFIAAAMMISVLVSFQLMFFEKESLISVLQPYKTDGNLCRNLLLLFSFILYFLRLIFTLFVLYQRKMYWFEAVIIMNLIPFIIPYTTVLSGAVQVPVGFLEIAGLGIYLFGSFLNTGSEVPRYLWKLKKQNEGQIYIQGIFKFAMHINYTGDVLLFSGIVMIAHEAGLLFKPVLMLLNFSLILVPLKNKYLKNKYKDGYSEYAAYTKKLILLIY